jgi:ABC-2 type transport system ATP-binding protein
MTQPGGKAFSRWKGGTMIEAAGLTRRFGDFTAVDRVSLRVPGGAILALLGPNGAGKTTTVRMLAGLIAPSDGQATVAGCDVRGDPAGVRARVGLVTDLPGLYEQMTAPAYLDFFGGVYGLPADARRRRIDELLGFFDLAAHRRERMAGFSKGMKQKVALARALLHQPTALFLDEPTSGLDPLASRAVRDLIRDLRGSNRSIILCTHDLDEAERLADEVAIIQHGRIVVSDTPAALRAGASPDTLVRIDLAASHPATIGILADLGLAALAPVAGANGAHGANTIAYRTPRPREVNPQVIARLAAAGAQIVAVDCETRTLEDVYAATVGREAAAAGVEEGA